MKLKYQIIINPIGEIIQLDGKMKGNVDLIWDISPKPCKRFLTVFAKSKGKIVQIKTKKDGVKSLIFCI